MELQVPENNGASTNTNKELAEKEALKLMDALIKKNNPDQPFITVLGEGEDQKIILNKPINVAGEGQSEKLARLMITTSGIVALDASPNIADYIDGDRGVRAAREKGYAVSAVLKDPENKDHFKSLLIDGINKTGNVGTDSFFRHLVPVLDGDFQDSGKIQQAIKESHREAQAQEQQEKQNQENELRLKLFQGLNAFVRGELGQPPSPSSALPPPPTPAATTT